MAVDHYENFPVASALMPARLRPAVRAIYAFARSADDIADEGDAAPAQRLDALRAYVADLDSIANGATPSSPILRNLAITIGEYDLPMQPFYDLLSAFMQDVGTTRYATYPQLLDYCQRSANPVGTLMLHLYGQATPGKLKQSDAICSALQLINFLQDVAIDWQKRRVYLPREDLQHFDVSEAHIADGIDDARWKALMTFQTNRARELMLSGAPLAVHLPGRIGWELRMVVQGGLRILHRIERAQYDVFRHRPSLGPTDWLAIMWRSVKMKERGMERTVIS